MIREMIDCLGFEMWAIIIFVGQLSSLSLFTPEWAKRSRSVWRKCLDCGVIQMNSPTSFCVWLDSDSAWNYGLNVIPVGRGAADVSGSQVKFLTCD